MGECDLAGIDMDCAVLWTDGHTEGAHTQPLSAVSLVLTLTL